MVILPKIGTITISCERKGDSEIRYCFGYLASDEEQDPGQRICFRCADRASSVLQSPVESAGRFRRHGVALISDGRRTVVRPQCDGNFSVGWPSPHPTRRKRQHFWLFSSCHNCGTRSQSMSLRLGVATTIMLF